MSSNARSSEFEPDARITEMCPIPKLCIAILQILERGFRKALLRRLRIEETMMNSFEYAGEGRIGGRLLFAALDVIAND